MPDYILSQNCRNTLPLHTVDQLREEYNCLSVVYQMEGYTNSDLVMILHCLNSFQHNKYVALSLLYVLLRENHKINAFCLPSLHNGCNSAYKV